MGVHGAGGYTALGVGYTAPRVWAVAVAADAVDFDATMTHCSSFISTVRAMIRRPI